MGVLIGTELFEGGQGPLKFGRAVGCRANVVIVKLSSNLLYLE